MPQLCDLHTHSTASDGQYAPAELARLVRSAGAEIWALTDHDTLDGLAEAGAAGTALGLWVLPGIELSAREYPALHLLGYGFSPADAGLRALCARLREGREARRFRILDYLREKGVVLDLAELEAMAGGSNVARPHFARAMAERGYVSGVREAFDRYLDTPEFHARIEREKPEARECLDTLHAAGGWVSMAHPYQTGLAGEELEALVCRLRGWGLDAIECFYPRHSPEQTEEYLTLAQRYGLRVTGGSDFHGEKVKPDIAVTPYELELF